jgi:hypothetical protein
MGGTESVIVLYGHDVMALVEPPQVEYVIAICAKNPDAAQYQPGDWGFDHRATHLARGCLRLDPTEPR